MNDCGHDHSNDTPPPFQTVTVEDDRTIALFTEDGRVFYDLGALVMQYNEVIDQNLIREKEAGTLDDRKVYFMSGQESTINAIADSGLTLLLEYKFSLASTGPESE